MNLFFEILIIFLLLLANGIFTMAKFAAVLPARPASGPCRPRRPQGPCRPRPRGAPHQLPPHRPDRHHPRGHPRRCLRRRHPLRQLSAWLATSPALAPAANLLGVFLAVGVITYFSLFVGELVPKRLALSNPEDRAMLIAKPMTGLSKLAAPAVWFLTISTNLVLKVFGLGLETPPSAEEISNLIEQGANAGVFHRAERAMVESVPQLDGRSVTAVLTRHTKIVALDIADSAEGNWRKIVASGHSHFPVYEGNRDHILGLVSVKSLWANAAGIGDDIRHHLTSPLFVPETIHLVQLLDTFQKSSRHLVLATGEFGGVQGLVALIDVMEASVGDLPEPGDRRAPKSSGAMTSPPSWTPPWRSPTRAATFTAPAPR